MAVYYRVFWIQRAYNAERRGLELLILPFFSVSSFLHVYYTFHLWYSLSALRDITNRRDEQTSLPFPQARRGRRRGLVFKTGTRFMIPHLDRMNEPITAILSVKTLLNLFFNLTAGRKTIFTELLAFILLKWALRRAHVRSYDSLSD